MTEKNPFPISDAPHSKKGHIAYNNSRAISNEFKQVSTPSGIYISFEYSYYIW